MHFQVIATGGNTLKLKYNVVMWHLGDKTCMFLFVELGLLHKRQDAFDIDKLLGYMA